MYWMGLAADSLTLHPVVSQRNPYAWNPFADGKLQFYNKDLESLVRGKQDRAVQEFWRLLAICHTVMVQEKDSECDQARIASPVVWGPTHTASWAWTQVTRAQRLFSPFPKPLWSPGTVASHCLKAEVRMNL